MQSLSHRFKLATQARVLSFKLFHFAFERRECLPNLLHCVARNNVLGAVPIERLNPDQVHTLDDIFAARLPEAFHPIPRARHPPEFRRGPEVSDVLVAGNPP